MSGFKPDDTAEFRKTITVADQAMFTGISGNLHPLYVDETHAQAVTGGGRLSFELAAAALITTALAEVGGPKARLAGLELSFPTAGRIGDTVAARAHVTSRESTSVQCAVSVVRDDGAVLAEGRARLALFG
jgi:3-hydroxybutyryl-CoA dehydratase